MPKIKTELSEQDIARNSDDYPRKVRCCHCGHKFIAHTEAQAEELRTIGCMNCARDKMRAHALRDRHPFRNV